MPNALVAQQKLYLIKNQSDYYEMFPGTYC